MRAEAGLCANEAKQEVFVHVRGDSCVPPLAWGCARPSASTAITPVVCISNALVFSLLASTHIHMYMCMFTYNWPDTC